MSFLSFDFERILYTILEIAKEMRLCFFTLAKHWIDVFHVFLGLSKIQFMICNFFYLAKHFIRVFCVFQSWKQCNSCVLTFFQFANTWIHVFWAFLSLYRYKLSPCFWDLASFQNTDIFLEPFQAFNNIKLMILQFFKFEKKT